jgi:hypothetical protein
MTSDVDILLNKKTSDVVILKEELIKNYSAELIDYLINDTRKHKDFDKANSVLKQLIELKKAYWPATQKSVQSNLDIFDDKLKKWIEARKKAGNTSKEIAEDIIVTINEPET